MLLNDGPLPVTTFNADGSWVANWDTSDLVHDRVYSVTVRAYDGDDYSDDIVWRMTINNPLDAENIDPVFNETGWVGTWTIFCDENSKSPDSCAGGVEFDLTDFFSDPDGTGDAANDLRFYVYDDPATIEDDYYFDFITISASGKLTYDPMDAMAQTTSNIPDWSLNSVVLYAQDDQESKAYSLKVNFLVRAISFSAERVDSGAITVNDPATFQGEGLPGSRVNARFADGDALLNVTVVRSDGTWSMDLTSSQLGIEGNSAIVFEMDSQYFRFAGQTEEEKGEFSITVAGSDDGSSGVFGIVLIVLAVLVLLGAGAFFFIEFEEVVDESDLTGDEAQEAEDPYAWAKAKQTPTLPEQHAAAPAQATPSVAEAAAPAASQHPGWLWDAESNQWVPDPNYQQPQQ